ncbi:MAG TPA: tRNA isopentenyl-2-thiomethyl-A-37 hydroxylase MiaE, partial [Pirellulales bacterium]
RDHLQDRELADFYGALFESEARHHATYVQFAKQFAPEEAVRARLHELAKQEAAIVAESDPWVRLHNS